MSTPETIAEQESLQDINADYTAKYGFHDAEEGYLYKAPKGINAEVVRTISEMKNEPQMVLDALTHLSSFLADIGNAYLDAGADFITIHEMGGSPGFIGPKPFEGFVLPALQHLTSSLPHPTVLSVCGKTDSAMSLLAQSGADAISVDQLNDLKASRAVLKDKLLFGNVDPVATLWQGNESSVAEAVQRSKEAGVDAVWPGCDMVIQTPVQNIKNMLG